MEEKIQVAIYLRDHWSIALNEQLSMEEIKEKLSARINELANNDFAGLINMLYAVDIDEARLKLLLKENEEMDAGNIISELIIERQLQKIRSRKNMKQDNRASDEERW